MTDSTAESGAESPPQIQKALWARSGGGGFPRTVKALAAVAAISAAWCVVELAWPENHVPELDMPAPAAGQENPDPGAEAGEEPSFSPLVFSARKLFIPEVPVESQETSRASIEEMLGRLRLTGVLEQDGQLVAWIEVSGAARESTVRRRAGTSGALASSRIERVVKGDHVLDFEVVEISPDSISLKVAGFEATLSF